MTIKIVYTRQESKKSSIEALNKHLDYLEDTTHPDHKRLTLHPACNHNCGPTAADFVAAIEETLKKCRKVRDVKPGKRTNDIWEEAICSMGEGCYHTEVEREAIERKMLDEICPDSPALTVWLDNPVTGEGVLRTIFPTINPEGKPNLERNTTSLCKRMEKLDEQISDMLNGAKSKPTKRKKHIPTAREVAKDRAKKPGKP